MGGVVVLFYDGMSLFALTNFEETVIAAHISVRAYIAKVIFSVDFCDHAT